MLAMVALLDAGLTGDQVRQNSFMEIDLEIFSKVISPFRWFKKGSCQFLVKDCEQYWLTTLMTKPAQ